MLAGLCCWHVSALEVDGLVFRQVQQQDLPVGTSHRKTRRAETTLIGRSPVGVRVSQMSIAQGHPKDIHKDCCPASRYEGSNPTRRTYSQVLSTEGTNDKISICPGLHRLLHRVIHSRRSCNPQFSISVTQRASKTIFMSLVVRQLQAQELAAGSSVTQQQEKVNFSSASNPIGADVAQKKECLKPSQ